MSYDEKQHSDMGNDLIYHPVLKDTFTVQGFVCEIKQIRCLQWNGYIQIPYLHPSYDINEDKANDEYDTSNVGGFTYCFPDIVHLCTTFGFDTAHPNDFQFSTLRWGIPSLGDASYKNYDFVKTQLEYLAKQFYDTFETYRTTCIYCASKATFQCGACKKYYYCSVYCQQQHWSEHKPICKVYRKQIINSNKHIV